MVIERESPSTRREQSYQYTQIYSISPHFFESKFETLKMKKIFVKHEKFQPQKIYKKERIFVYI